MKTMFDIKAMLLLCAILLAGRMARGENLPFEDWNATGPSKGSFQSFVCDATNADHIMALGSKSVYSDEVPRTDELIETTDGGLSWTLVMNFTNRAAGNSLIGNDTRHMYLVGPGNWISTSVDGGRTWTDATPPPYNIAYNACVNPTNSRTVYLGGMVYTNGSYTFAFGRSDDSGQTWTIGNHLNFGPRGASMNAITVSPSQPDTILACGYYASNASGSYAVACLSTNGGVSWRDISSVVESQPFSSLSTVAFDPHDCRRMYVVQGAGAVSKGYFYSSADGGTSWQRNLSVSNMSGLAVDPMTSGTLYAVCQSGATNAFFSSKDHGVTWTVGGLSCADQFSAGFGYGVSKVVVVPANVSNILTAVVGTGSQYPYLYASKTQGQTFVPCEVSSFFSIHCLMSKIYTAPSQSSRVFMAANYFSTYGAFRSDNGGDDWTYCGMNDANNGALRPLGFAVHPADPNKLLAWNFQ